MNRLVHNRALLLILVALLQIGLLPGLGRGRCSMRGGGASCCCVPSVPEPAAPEKHGCCAVETSHGASATQRVATPIHDPAPADGPSTCRCAADDDSERPATSPERDRHPVDHGLPCEATRRSHHGLAASKRTALRALPRAATGPPIHLVYQVFTI